MTNKLYTLVSRDGTSCGYNTKEEWVEIFTKQCRSHLIDELVEVTDKIRAANAIEKERVRLEIERAVAREEKEMNEPAEVKAMFKQSMAMFDRLMGAK